MRSSDHIRSWISWLILAGCAVTLAGGQTASSQGKTVPEASAPSAALPVLHVYTDLLQIPVLVLDHDQERLNAPAAASRFSVSLSGGPWFHPVHVREQGEDPISLSILLDMRGWTSQIMPKVDDAIASLGMGPLHEQDKVTVYALDCELSTVQGRIGPDAAELKSAVYKLMLAAAERKAAPGGCKHGDRLWDALFALTAGAKSMPGRRIIVAVSDGEDSGSQHTWRDVVLLAQESSITTVGISFRPPALSPVMGGNVNRGIGGGTEVPFFNLCGLTGGLVSVLRDSKLGPKLDWVVAAMRERYIVEFPRPVNATPGRHDMTVRLENGPDLYVRVAGLAFPGRSEAELNDPTTIKADPSRLPTQGNRKVMSMDH